MTKQQPDFFDINALPDNGRYISMDHRLMHLLDTSRQSFDRPFEAAHARNKGDDGKTKSNIKHIVQQFIKKLATLETCDQQDALSIKGTSATLPGGSWTEDSLAELTQRIRSQLGELIPVQQSLRDAEYLKMPIGRHISYIEGVLRQDTPGKWYDDAHNLGKAMGTMQYLLALNKLVDSLDAELKNPHLSIHDRIKLAINDFEKSINSSNNPHQLAELKTSKVSDALRALKTADSDEAIRQQMNLLRIELARGCNYISTKMMQAYDADYNAQNKAMFAAHRRDERHETPFTNNAYLGTSEGYKAKWANAAAVALSLIEDHREILTDASIKPMPIEYIASGRGGSGRNGGGKH